MIVFFALSFSYKPITEKNEKYACILTYRQMALKSTICGIVHHEAEPETIIKL